MENINLYDLAFAFSQREQVEDAHVATGMYTDDTIKTVMRNGTVVAIGVQDEYPAVALYTIYANDEDYRNKEPLTEGLHYDFEDDHDYKDGVEAIIKEACQPMDTIIFVKDRDWPGTDSRVYEIQVSNLVAICVSCWVLLEDGRFSGDVLPDKGLRERYFALYEHGGEQANWDAFIDDLWQTADDMDLEQQADWFVQLHDPVTIKARYWVHDGVEYLDAAHTLTRDED